MSMGKRPCLILLAALFLMFPGCDREKDTMLEELLEVEEGAYRDRDVDVSSKTIDELKEGIRLLEADIERTVEAGEQLVNYHRLVAEKYMDRELYGLAASFFRKALDMQPANRLVAYRIGVCAAQVAMSQAEEEIRKIRFEEAERYYLYAIHLDPLYADALYALAVLYIFEMDRSGEAEAYLERLVAAESRHFRGMFLLARVYASFGRVEDAVALYDEIIRESGDDSEVDQAKRNRNQLTGDAYGG